MSTNRNVLVAEDDYTDQFFLKRFFLQAGINASLQFVDDGEQAMHYLQGTGKFQDRKKYPLPEILLLDLKMPRMSGFDVLKWLRSQEQFGALITVVLSSSDLPRDVQQAYELGARSYLRKRNEMDGIKELTTALGNYWLRLNCSCPQSEGAAGQGPMASSQPESRY